jgi:tetratricopeptide (TPR) repeat protein
LLAVLALVATAGGYWYWRERGQAADPIPPDVALEGVEPDVRAAISQARKRVVEEPKSALAWGDLGMVLRAHAFDGEADECFKVASELDGQDARWPYYRGLQALLRDPGNALRFLRRAAELGSSAPDYDRALQFRLAEALIERNQFAEAEGIVQRFHAADPSDARASYDMGLIALAQGNARAARAYLEPCAKVLFVRKKATAHLAFICQQLDDPSAAAQYADASRRALEDAPWPDPYVSDYLALEVGLQSRYLRAETLKSQGRLAEAARAFEEIAQRVPNPRSLVAAGISLAEVGDYARAEEFLRSCLKLEPEHIQANYFLAVTLFFQAERNWSAGSKGDSTRAQFAECAKYARASLSQKPDHALAYQFLGRALLYLDEKKEAAKQLRMAVACRPESVDSQLYLAEALLKLGEKSDADAVLKTAESLAGMGDPRIQNLRQRLAKKLDGKGD